MFNDNSVAIKIGISVVVFSVALLMFAGIAQARIWAPYLNGPKTYLVGGKWKTVVDTHAIEMGAAKGALKGIAKSIDTGDPAVMVVSTLFNAAKGAAVATVKTWRQVIISPPRPITIYPGPPEAWMPNYYPWTYGQQP